LALWEPPYSVDPAQFPIFETYKNELSKALSEGRRGDAVDLFMTLVGAPPEAIAGMHQAPFFAAMEALAPTLAYDAAVLGDQSVPEKQAASVAIPTFVLDGGASPDSMRNAAHAVADAIDGAKYETLADQTHEVAADVLVPRLKEFFAR
jgi:hypothetical protein